MASLMSKEEFLSELKKRKAELKLYLAKVAEAKSDYEISNFRFQWARDEYLLAMEPLLIAYKEHNIDQIPLAFFFAHGFPRISSYGSASSGSHRFNQSLEDALENYSGELVANEGESYEEFIQKFYALARQALNIEFYRQQDPLTLISSYEGFKRVYPAPNGDYNIQAAWFAEIMNEPDFWLKVEEKFNSYIDQTGHALYNYCLWNSRERFAKNRIEDTKRDLESFSAKLKAFLAMASEDSELAGLVPSFEQIMKEVESEKNISLAPEVMVQDSAEIKKSKAWMYALAAGAAAYYFLGN